MKLYVILRYSRCYIGSRKLESAMAEFVKEHPDIQFTPPRWRPFFLLHDLPEEGLSMKEFIIRKFGEEKVRTKKFYIFIVTHFVYNSWITN